MNTYIYVFIYIFECVQENHEIGGSKDSRCDNHDTTKYDNDKYNYDDYNDNDIYDDYLQIQKKIDKENLTESNIELNKNIQLKQNEEIIRLMNVENVKEILNEKLKTLSDEVYVCIYMYIYVYIYVCIYIYVYLYTYMVN
jgi:hypothetical protein